MQTATQKRPWRWTSLLVAAVLAALPVAARAGGASPVSGPREQLFKVYVELRRQFDASPDVMEAQTAVTRARSAYDSASAQCLAVLHQSERYRAAEVEIQNLEASLDKAREAARLSGAQDSEAVQQLAEQLLSRRIALSRMDEQAVEQDSGAMSARYAWLDAEANLYSLQSQFTQRVRSDPQWCAAKAQYEQARAQLIASARY